MRFHRIPFDVVLKTVEFALIANPVIEGFVLPKRKACSMEKVVRLSRCDTFQRAGNLLDLKLWSDQQMNVVRHDGIGMQIVVLQFGGSSENSRGHELSYRRVLQPNGTGMCLVKNFLSFFEPLSG